MVRFLLAAAFTAATFSGAQAAAQSSLESDITACIAVTVDQERLACFDAVAARAATNRTSASSPVESAKVTERRFFGFARGVRPVKKEQEFGVRQQPEDGITQIAAKIKDVTIRYDKATRIELDNGQVWQQISSDSTLLRRFKSDIAYSATIKKASLGSYRMTVEPMGKTIRVKRLQ